MQLRNTIRHPERALLVAVQSRLGNGWDIEDSVDELAQLTDTARGRVVGRILAKVDRPNPATYLGKGKVDELAQLARDCGADVVIFDDDLSPVQARNLEKACETRIIDRSQLILDIFSRRARTKESQLQVELAQLKYLLPRLTRQWLHLSRQEGGIGARGPGETQLEVDRRRVKDRIQRLARDLDHIDTERDTQRRRREKMDLAVVSIVGYTNAGKTTLFNRLAECANLVEDRLFATLDSTVRTIKVNAGPPFLVSDTVGFIRKLPHHLIESFKSTLEEVVGSDLLLHLVDAGDHLLEEKIQVVLEVLEDIGAGNIPRLTVLNKIDLVDNPMRLHSARFQGETPILVSARSGFGMDRLAQEISRALESRFVFMRLFIPHGSANRLVDLVHRSGRVLDRRFEENGVYLEIEIPKRLEHMLLPYKNP